MGYNQSGYFWLFRGTRNSFFIRPIVENQQRKSEHQKQIVDMYRGWSTLPNTIKVGYHLDKEETFQLEGILQKIDFITFDPLRLRINIIKSVLPEYHINFAEETNQEWALSHLNCEDYKNAFTFYSEIWICQNCLNTKIKKFLNETRQHLKQLVEYDKDDTKIDSLVRYYLTVVVQANKHPHNFEDGLKNLNSITIIPEEHYDFPRLTLSNPFPDKLDGIKKDMISRKDFVIDSIDKFKLSIDKLNELILEFQRSLKPIIDNVILGVKGTCTIEKKLSLSHRLKSICHKSK